ncbi:MAG: DHH family phosphoesterase [Candidatus Cloacimonadaceae bacterium]|jgi:single-stranded-DNA-specific exonuclease|nr:DHH family phosphoesterase [Candidatus Cloacimonadota bacterium]MDX9949550.1 DHH family phosphoesterase [Candidatus Syntrophosphaera sp.]
MVEDQYDIDPKSLLGQICAKRKIDPGSLWDTLEVMPDEALLANIENAADRISRAMRENESSVIFGHDDPDGITSTYILYQFFNSCGYQKHNYYIPNRNLEPHGIQDGFINYVKEGGHSLAITVDNGITSPEGIQKLSELGCDTVITDHHLIRPEVLPKAYAIVNPQLPQCEYPYKSLAGVGVTLLLIRYLAKILDHSVPLSSYFWTAVGSIADKVPMTGLNRVLVRHVISNWDELEDPSVEFLLRNHPRVETDTEIFNFIQYTARLIANGREAGGQHTAMRFLLQMGDAKAELFQSMESQQKKWESELGRIFNHLDSIASGFNSQAFIYFDDEEFIPYHLLGTGATYILGKLGVPTILLRHHNGMIVCEGRCGEGFNMVEAFGACKEHLKQFGGHVKAAGFIMEPENYDAFLECYNAWLSENLKPVETHEDEPDVCLPLERFNAVNWSGLELLLPFGQQHPEPRILVKNVRLAEIQKLFTFDHGSRGLPPDKTVDIQLYWKAPRLVKILSVFPSENKS